MQVEVGGGYTVAMALVDLMVVSKWRYSGSRGAGVGPISVGPKLVVAIYRW